MENTNALIRGRVHLLNNEDSELPSENVAFWLYYVETGKVETVVDGRRYQFLPEEITLLSQMPGHDTKYSPDASGIAIGIGLTEMVDSFSLPAGGLGESLAYDLIKKLFQAIGKHNKKELLSFFKYVLKHHQELHLPEIVSKVNELSQQTIVEGLSKMMQIKRHRLSTRIANLQCVEEARRILDDSLGKKFDLTSLSRQALMSKYALIRNFKEVFSITPHQYYISKKVEYAKILLSDGASVKEAAMKCGYPDVFSFSKQFKDVVGFPPSRLRIAC
jgi:AraC-like DNA-binding protein